VGGGRFEILVPEEERTAAVLAQALHDVGVWLLDTFEGDYSLQAVHVPIRAADLQDMRAVYSQLESELQVKKLNKWHHFLGDEEFYLPSANNHTPTTEKFQALDAKIGQKLPHIQYIACAYTQTAPQHGEWLSIFRDRFGVCVGLLTEEEHTSLFKSKNDLSPMMVFRLNDTDFLIPGEDSAVERGFRFLSNYVPTAKERLTSPYFDPIEKGDVLHFDAIAELGVGASVLGILKADVDHLGFLLSEGLEETTAGGAGSSMAGLSALSRTNDLFFSGWLSNMCDKLFHQWKAEESAKHEKDRNTYAAKVQGLFYILYAGGDDLFIIGPWYQVLRMAERLNDDWRKYVCQNTNVTLSAGIMMAKPHYPIQRMASEAGTSLEEAKEAGRNRICVFGEIVPWREDANSFSDLMAFSCDLIEWVIKDKVPRTLIHDVGQMTRKYYGSQMDKPSQLMWHPMLYYTLARRTGDEIREELAAKIINHMEKIIIPVSIVSLATRKE
jgi:CRISPR-associated protein Csm1